MKKSMLHYVRSLPQPVKTLLKNIYYRVFNKKNIAGMNNPWKTDDAHVSYNETNNPWNADSPVSYNEMWLGTKECNNHIQQKISGNPDVHWLPYVIDKYFQPALGLATSQMEKEAYRCLLLGSSEGHMERMLCEKGFTGEIIASDIAEKALARAELKTKTLGYKNVNYVMANLNTDTFEGKFDYIIAEGVLHHIENIESCLKMLSSVLKPNGYFILVEFEGPFRFQLPDSQVRWINAALSILPKELRPFPKRVNDQESRLPATPDENKSIYYVAPSEAEIMAFDPSEAISGPTLKHLIPMLFDIVERTGFGGTLLSYMTGHFDFQRANEDEFAKSWLKILIQIEDTVIQHKLFDDDFVFYVLQNKTTIID